MGMTVPGYEFPPAAGGFRARCVNVVDGDTIDVCIDLGFGLSLKERVRLAGVNTPELHGSSVEEKALAQKAKQFTYENVRPVTDPDSWPLRLTTVKVNEKFGRYLANVYMTVADKELHLNAMLIAAGHAKPYDGGKR